MRKFINIISEAIRPTATRTRSTVDIDTAPESMGDLTAPSRTSVANAPTPSASASASDTSRAWASGSAAAVDWNPNILRDLEGLRDTEQAEAGFDVDTAMQTLSAGHDDVPALPAATTTPTNDNLPAVINQTIVAVDDQEIGEFAPQWHQIKNLPGYMQTGIRQVAREFFRTFTNTRIEEVQLVCSLLNPEDDVRKTAEWVLRHGEEVDGMEFDFREKMPAYAQMAGATVAKLYRVGGYEFIVMRDNGGHYVYGYAAGDRRMGGGMNPNQPLLGENEWTDKFDLDTPEHQNFVGKYKGYKISKRLDDKFYVYPPNEHKAMSGGSDTYEDAVARAKADHFDDGYDDDDFSY